MFQKTCFRACFLLALVAQAPAIFREAAAQDPIRVQSNEVLVPTVVFDKVIYAQLNKMKPHRRDSYGHLVVKNEKLWDSIAVKGLTEKDFHLFEDGVEQNIQRVRLEPPAFRVVEDNLGKHPEIVGSGGGLWSYPDTPQTDMRMWLAWPQYVLAYAPAKSAPGSCHQIQVKVGRANLEVWTRSEYCNTDHPASDPLRGTEFGKQLEAKANTGTLSDIDLEMKVWAFADNPDTARVYVSIDFPWQPLSHEFRDGTLYATVGLLVMVYRKDGTLASQYSDFACCDYGNQKKLNTSVKQTESQRLALQPLGAEALLPDRYETQFALSPGEYRVRAVLSDGVHFGEKEVPLTVASYDASKLGISDVALSRRARKVPAEETEAAAQVANSYSPLISKGVEFTPTPNPQFWPSDTLFAYFEINDPLADGQPGPKVQVSMKITATESGTEVDTFAPVDTTTYRKAGSPLTAVARGVPLKRLTPGMYRLDVQASNAEGKSTEWRSAVFTVMDAAPLEMGETGPPKREEVILNVTVLDSEGHPVADLTSADFQIFEDVTPREITSFEATSAQNPPGSRPLPIVILFDLMNTAWSEREYIANRIIKVLNPLETDEGIYLYLLTPDGALYAVRPHATGQAAAIKQGNIAGSGEAEKPDDAPWTKKIRSLLMNAINDVRGFREGDYEPEAWRAPMTFRRLSELEDDFSAVRGPKTLLWITGGVAIRVRSSCENNVISSAMGTYASGICSGACQLPKAAGMSAILGTCMDYTPFLEHFAAGAVAADTTVVSVGLTETGQSTDSLADLTGGQVYMNTDADLKRAIQRAVAGRNARYRLKFAAAERDGKYHKLQVLCTRAGAHVVGPRGYFAVAR